MSTEIAWTDETWNPTTGCDRVSPGCDHCYAMTLAKRLKAMGQAKYQNDGDPRTSGPGFALTTHADALELPMHWRKPRRVFVNSMSDLFHPDVPEDFIHRVWNTMSWCEQHTFQILTKRPQRMAKVLSGPHVPGYFNDGSPPANVWVGTSVEDERYARVRIPHLTRTRAVVRFLSMEPLLGPVDLWPWLDEIDWVIVGGESGPGARPMELDWAEWIVDQCIVADVPVFVKQLGSVLGGKRHADIDTFPAPLRVREFPAAVLDSVGP